MNEISFAENRATDMIGIGRLCIDLNANEIHRPMEQTRTFTKYVGGSPANITIALARLGKKTGFIGRVSDDQHGRFITNYLKENNIDTSSVVIDRSGSVTGLAFTEILSPTECSILMYRDNAADLKLEPSDVNEQVIQNTKALLISGTALAKSPSREAVFRALEYALTHQVIVIFDIDYRPYSWGSTDEAAIYCNLVAEKSDIILGGRNEFDIMERRDATKYGSEHDAKDIDLATANNWFKYRAKIVLIKRGEKGSTAFTPDRNRVEGKTYPAEVVKTFGAGDSFAGAFIYGLIEGWTIERSQQFGSASASIVVSSHSCSDAMPTVEQIEQIIAQHHQTD